GVPFDDALRARIEPRPIERVCHRADQSFDGSSWQPRVAVQRDDVADTGRRARRRQKRRVLSSPEQAVQLVELPALALPSHPRAFALVPEAPTMEQEESLTAALDRPVASFKAPPPLPRRSRGSLAPRHCLGRPIRPIGEKSEAKIAIL